jgi:hypothetical protein
MKKQGYILQQATLVLFVFLAAGVGQAQSESRVIRVNIPFDFNVGVQRFSAGEYTLAPLFSNTTLLRNQKGRVLTTIATNSVESRQVPGTVKLIFNRYSERYFLSQIWDAGNEIGRELPKSSAETEVAGEYSPSGAVALNFATRY